MLLQDPQQLTTSPPSSTQPVSPPSYSLPPSPTPSPPLKPLKRSGKFSTKDRKQRKKLQNKTAALRYRQKKKDEYEVLQEKEKELEAKNAKLKQQATDLAAELAYLKNLWIEIYQPKAKN
jgi:activating transcription factor 5